MKYASPWFAAGVALILVRCVLNSVSAAPASSTNGRVVAPAFSSKAPPVGMEGRIEIVVPGTLLEAKPIEDRSRMVLRIASASPHGTLIRYDLRYVGLVPGTYDLRDYLVRKDGSPTNDLPAVPVLVTGLLPPDHNGQLLPQPPGPFRRLAGYRLTMIILAALWLVVFIPLWLMGRSRAHQTPVTYLATEPTLADRLRPLVEQAAQGRLTIDGQAHLERLLVAHWRERLGLTNMSAIDAVQNLKAHPEAGSLLRELENWLHRPPGTVNVDVNRLLAPYGECSFQKQQSPASIAPGEMNR